MLSSSEFCACTKTVYFKFEGFGQCIEAFKMYCILFADDKTIFILVKILNGCWRWYKQDLGRYQLGFNLINCHWIWIKQTVIFHIRKKNIVPYRVDGVQIYRTSEVKSFLCCYWWKADLDLSCKLFKNKIAKSIVLLFKVKELINDKAVYILYKVMIVPHLI